MTTKTGFRPDINALRALAVGIVVLFHFKLPGFGGGFTGVDIFFVISGYLMTKILVEDLQRDRFNYLAFIGMRVVRIWPALIVLLLVLLLIGAVALPPGDYKDLANQLKAAALFNSNNLYAQGLGYFAPDIDERWMLHTWSLSVEWQFYMLYPAILFLAHRLAMRVDAGMDEKRLCKVLLIWLLALSGVSFAFNLWSTAQSQASAFFSLPTRIWEMLGGGIIYLLAARTTKNTQAEKPRLRAAVQAFSFAALLITVLAASVGDWEKKWPGGWALFPVIFTMLALAAGSPTQGIWRRVIENPFIQYLGLRSYSIYLWHWPVVIALNYITFNQAVLPYMPALKAGGMVASVVLGHLSYRWVEKTFSYQRQEKWFQLNTIKSVAGMAVAFVCAFYVVLSSGWISRTGADQKWYEAMYDLKTTPISPKECENFQKKRDELIVCSVNGEKSGGRVLVYGDSHAQHLHSWFAKNSDQPVDLFWSGGCPPIPHHNRKEPGFFCDQYVEEALKRASNSEYETIIVAGNWSGIMALCESKESICNDHQSSNTEKFNTLVRENSLAWGALTSRGKTVVILDQFPISTFNVMTTTLRRKFFNMPRTSTFEDSQSTNPSGKRYVDAVFSQLGDPKGLHRISLKPEICPDEKCQIFDESSELPILTDKSHLAPWWIKSHGNVLHQYVD